MYEKEEILAQEIVVFEDTEREVEVKPGCYQPKYLGSVGRYLLDDDGDEGDEWFISQEEAFVYFCDNTHE